METRLPSSGIAMAFKLIECAQHRWRAVNAPHLVALVRDQGSGVLSICPMMR